MAVRTKKITYTPANIYAMNGTPQKVLDAPASGYANQILGVSHDMVYNSAAYTGAAQLIYGFNAATGQSVYVDGNLLTQTANYNMPASVGVQFNGAYTTEKDFYVTTDNVAATGDSDVVAYIVYEEKLLDT